FVIKSPQQSEFLNFPSFHPFPPPPPPQFVPPFREQFLPPMFQPFQQPTLSQKPQSNFQLQPNGHQSSPHTVSNQHQTRQQLLIQSQSPKNVQQPLLIQPHSQQNHQPQDLPQHLPQHLLPPQPTRSIQNTIPSPSVFKTSSQLFPATSPVPTKHNPSTPSLPQQRQSQPQIKVTPLNRENQPRKFNGQFGLPPSKLAQSQVVITPLTTFPHVPQPAKKMVEPIFDYTQSQLAHGSNNQPIEETYPKVTTPALPLINSLAPNHFAADTFMDHPIEFPPENDKNYASPGFHSGHRGFPSAVTPSPTTPPTKTLRNRGKSPWRHSGSPKRSDQTYYVPSKPTVYHYEIKHTS
ncbi:hypothetical protein CHUAL_009729, partial [Chamberlinius hualienensis]